MLLVISIGNWRFLKGVGQFRSKFQVQGMTTTNHLCTIRQASLTTFLLTLFTQRNTVADFLQEKSTYRWKMAILHFGLPRGAYRQECAVRLKQWRIQDLQTGGGDGPPAPLDPPLVLSSLESAQWTSY